MFKKVLKLFQVVFKFNDNKLKTLFIFSIITILLTAIFEVLVLLNISIIGSIGNETPIPGASYLYLLIFFISAAFFRVLQIYICHSFVYKIGARLSEKENKDFFFSEFSEIKKIHSAQYLKRYELINLVVNNVLNPVMILFSNFTIFSLMLIVLFYQNFELMFFAFMSILIFYGFTIFLISPRLLRNSDKLSELNENKIYNLKESFQGVKELYLSGYLSKYLQLFSENEMKLRNLQAMNLVYGASPRYMLEIFAVLGMVIYFTQDYYFNGPNPDLISALIPFGYAAIRILPISQAIYSGWASLKAHITIVDEVSKPLINIQNQALRSNISSKINNYQYDKKMLLKISFMKAGYNKNTIIDCKDLVFDVGKPYLLKGQSGTGKTTFVESLMGLAKSDSKIEFINGNSIIKNTDSEWHHNFAYASQQGFLTNTTIKENLSIFSSKFILDETIHILLDKLNLYKIVNESGGINNILLENGKNLSGGQRQRLSFASVLLSDRPVLIFDEITSNLDDESATIIEELIFEESKNKICLFITHRKVYNHLSHNVYFEKLSLSNMENPINKDNQDILT